LGYWQIERGCGAIASRRMTSMNRLSDQRINTPLRNIVILLLCSSGLAGSQKKPCSREEIVNNMLARHVPSTIILKNIRDRRVDFELTKSDASELRKKGATQEIINAIRENGPTVYSDFDKTDKFTQEKYWCVSGAITENCGTRGSRWVAAPFDVTQTFTLSGIALALGNQFGKNGAEINLRESTPEKLPGGILESWPVADLPNRFSVPLKITKLTSKGTLLQAGQRYWLEVKGVAGDTLDIWFTNTRGEEGGMLNFNDSGWKPLSDFGQGVQTRPAFAVSGLRR
jgi:hypothetical protein